MNIIIYTKILPNDTCQNIFVYGRCDKNTDSQTNSSIKDISNTYGGVLEYVLEYLIDKNDIG